jgi:hypothetical protein
MLTDCREKAAVQPPVTDGITVTSGTTAVVDSVSSADNRSYEEGTNPADEIVKTTQAEKVIPAVSFGKSFNKSRYETIGCIETALNTAFPGCRIRQAFTSQIIINKIAGRDKLNIDTVKEAMDRLVPDKVKEVVIQPAMVMTGYEYDGLVKEVRRMQASSGVSKRAKTS